MTKKSVSRLILVLAAAFVLQASFLLSTQREVRISWKSQRVYVHEGDLVSVVSPEYAEDASKAVEEMWLVCRYWTGITFRILLSPGICPLITPSSRS